MALSGKATTKINFPTANLQIRPLLFLIQIHQTLSQSFNSISFLICTSSITKIKNPKFKISSSSSLEVLQFYYPSLPRNLHRWFQESSKFSLKKLSSRCKIEILSIRKYSLGTLGVKTRLPPPLPSSWREIARLTSFGGSAVIRFTWKAKRAKCTTRCNTGQQYVIHFNRTRCLALRPPSSLCTPLHRPSLSFTFDSLPPPLISTRLRHRAPFSSFARITGQAGPGNWFPRDGRVSGIGD